MLSINTNLSSLIAQRSMKQSTNKLNQAIERMTTGAKINHAKDNAANYSISTNMTTKIGSYNVAEDNCAMGLDLVTTASDILATMQNHAQRLRSLSIQSRNRTYDNKSLDAINTEVCAIVSEINRLYNSAEYNNVALFNRKEFEVSENIVKAGASGFIDESTDITVPKAKAEYNAFIDNPKTYTDEEIMSMTTITQAIATSSLVSGEQYSISTVDELIALADYVNAGKNTSGMTFVLGADIDLSSISNWKPIGSVDDEYDSIYFSGVFDGNGHVIKNITIDRIDEVCIGLFGKLNGSVQNLGIVGGSVKGGKYTGGLVGYVHDGSPISNCYATCSVKGSNNTGGFIGEFYRTTIKHCYATGNVKGRDEVGGFAGSGHGTIDCFATGNVEGTSYVGGFIGWVFSNRTMQNCYATGNVSGSSIIGGLAGNVQMYTSIYNSFATGNVISSNGTAGGLIGSSSYDLRIKDCYTTGDITGKASTGGLLGVSSDSHSSIVNVSEITNSYTTGKITSTESYAGGLVGCWNATSNGKNCIRVSDSYTNGTVKGKLAAGGLIGYYSNTVAITGYNNANKISNCSSYAEVNCEFENSAGGVDRSCNFNFRRCKFQ